MPELRSPLPCLTCKADAAFDVKFALGQGMFQNGANLTPNGTPIMCCRVRVLGPGPAPLSAPPAGFGQRSAAPSGGLFSFGGRRSAGGWPPWRQPPLRR
jgi:hypothetical protein